MVSADIAEPELTCSHHVEPHFCVVWMRRHTQHFAQQTSTCHKCVSQIVHCRHSARMLVIREVRDDGSVSVVS